MKENLTAEDGNKSVISAGERSISIGGNVTDTNFFTGDINIHGQDAQIHLAVLNTLGSKIENLSTDLSKEKASNLEYWREKFREGYFDEGFQGIWELKNSSNWDSFEPALRAGILRALASMTLAVKGRK